MFVDCVMEWMWGDVLEVLCLVVFEVFLLVVDYYVDGCC